MSIISKFLFLWPVSVLILVPSCSGSSTHFEVTLHTTTS